MQLTLANDTGTVATATVQPTDHISILSPTVATTFSIPVSDQCLLHNAVPLDPLQTFSAAGISDGDLLMVVHQTQSPSTTTPSTSSIPAATTSPPAISGLLQRVRSNPQLMAQLRTASPALADRIARGDPTVEPELFAMLNQARSAMPWTAGGAPPGSAPATGAMADPFSADAQRDIEESIRKENVRENLEAALEYNPESFGSVVMLFVDCKINAVAGVKAFVDSGAQTTIISKQCAERCNILRLLDTRFEGVAVGVGSAKIFGRIHLALLTLGKSVFEISLTVMDSVGGGYDMLLGLDMLRKHRASIDLSEDVLRIGGEAVPFLAEKDIPRSMRESKQASSENEGSTPKASAAGASGASSGTPSAAQQPSGNPADGVDAAAVRRLVELGFAENEAVQALRMCGGNADEAAAFLMSSKYGV